MRWIVLSLMGLLSSLSWAMTPYKTSLSQKKNAYVNDGVFTGGQAGQGSSLLSVRRSFSARAQLERVILDMGDKNAKPAGRDMGYFQASLDSTNNRVVVDIAQLKMSRVNEQQIRQLFRNDPYVASIDMTMDPQDQAATLVLNLKRPMRLEVFQLLRDKMPARIVLDLTPRTASAVAPAPLKKKPAVRM